jgi:hypothetical protein
MRWPVPDFDACRISGVYNPQRKATLDTFKESLSVLADALVNFGVLAAAFTLAGLSFGVALSGVSAAPAGLIARRGLFAAIRIHRRAERVARLTPRSHLHSSTHHAVVLVLYSIGAAALTIWALWTRLVSVAAGQPFVSVAAVVGLGLLGVFAAYQVGPPGLLRAIKLGGKPRSHPGYWPPPIPTLLPGVDRDLHFVASGHLYRLQLHVYLLRDAAWAALVLTLLPLVMSDDSEPFTITYLPAVALLMLIESTTGQRLRRRFRRIHALALVARYLEPRPQVRGHSHGPVRPTGPSRRHLVAIVAATERYAHHLQHQQGSVIRHPVAHLLLMSTAHLREYLSGMNSMSDSAPDDIMETLRGMASFLAGSTAPGTLAEFEARLAHLEGHISEAAPRRSWSDWFPGVLDLTDRTVKLAAWVIGLAILVWLVSTQRISVADFVQRIP